MSVPALVCPRAPAGEQKAPGCTLWTYDGGLRVVGRCVGLRVTGLRCGTAALVDGLGWFARFDGLRGDVGILGAVVGGVIDGIGPLEAGSLGVAMAEPLPAVLGSGPVTLGPPQPAMSMPATTSETAFPFVMIPPAK